ncbi:MAG: diphthine synthase [Candidatus Altarchaeum sp.]|nr:diphthine synthase [Candidatus Altarchaeum sp.]
MLYLVGLGLYDEKDISLRAIEILKSADEIYAENYTNFYHGNLKNLEATIGKNINTLKRNDIESGEILYKDALLKNIALLIPGDPMLATTHSSIILDAKKRKIKVKVIHSSSIYSAIAETGLMTYKFGRTTTIAFPYKDTIPSSPYKIFKENSERNLHTLMLLDIDVESNKFLSINHGLEILLKLEEGAKKDIVRKATFVCCARLGSDNAIIKTVKGENIEKILNFDFGNPPHCIIAATNLHFIEEEMIAKFY